MDRLEGWILDSWDKKPFVWMRYMEDVFFWTHWENCLMEFISHLNSGHHTIKFTSEYSRTALSLSDVSIKVGVGGGDPGDRYMY